jgi:signal-transduction protein with cAMP-binding, CBS, and nucleotidyltransferase domain
MSLPKSSSLFLNNASDGASLYAELTLLFKTNEVFQGIAENEESISILCRTCSFRFFKDGDIIIRDREMAQSVFFLLKGTVTFGTDFENVFAELSAPEFCM